MEKDTLIRFIKNNIQSFKEKSNRLLDNEEVRELSSMISDLLDNLTTLFEFYSKGE